MKRLTIAAIALGIGSAAVVMVQAVTGSTQTSGVGPPAIYDPTVPEMAKDVGIGEQIVLVVGGQFVTKDAADAASQSFDFGEVQGFYTLPVTQFQGLSEQLSNPSAQWVLASAFRTQEGAEEFAAVARAAGADPFITARVTSRGGEFAGLGEEPDPSGAGPLTHSVPESQPVASVSP